MVNLRRLSSKAREMIDKRGGTDALKDDAQELRDIAKGPGSMKDKAKAAAAAMKDPGARGEGRPREGDPAQARRPAGTRRPANPPEREGPTRSK
jgi:hypothetical protein